MFALLGPNGAGKTTTLEILEGFLAQEQRHGPRARRRPGGRESTVARAGRHRAPRCGRRALPQSRARCSNATRATTRSLGAWTKCSSSSGSREKADARVEDALGWTATAPRRRSRHHRRAGASLPRRAHDGLRPDCTARGLGARRPAPRRRRDDHPHDPLHGRGPAPRRPCRRHQPGRDRRVGHSRDHRRALRKRRCASGSGCRLMSSADVDADGGHP